MREGVAVATLTDEVSRSSSWQVFLHYWFICLLISYIVPGPQRSRYMRSTVKIHNDKVSSTRGGSHPAALSLGSRLCELGPGHKIKRHMRGAATAGSPCS